MHDEAVFVDVQGTVEHSLELPADVFAEPGSLVGREKYADVETRL
jgi:hypothetical protein